jgi:hypothetical protein
MMPGQCESGRDDCIVHVSDYPVPMFLDLQSARYRCLLSCSQPRLGHGGYYRDYSSDIVMPEKLEWLERGMSRLQIGKDRKHGQLEI